MSKEEMSCFNPDESGYLYENRTKSKGEKSAACTSDNCENDIDALDAVKRQVLNSKIASPAAENEQKADLRNISINEVPKIRYHSGIKRVLAEGLNKTKIQPGFELINEYYHFADSLSESINTHGEGLKHFLHFVHQSRLAAWLLNPGTGKMEKNETCNYAEGIHAFPSPSSSKKDLQSCRANLKILSRGAYYKRHATMKRFFCQICKKGFRKKCNLKVHVTIHTGDKLSV